MCLAQGHKAVTPVRLEPVAPQSQVKHCAPCRQMIHTKYQALFVILKEQHMVNALKFQTLVAWLKGPRQTGQAQIRLFLNKQSQKQSDQGLPS